MNGNRNTADEAENRQDIDNGVTGEKEPTPLVSKGENLPEDEESNRSDNTFDLHDRYKEIALERYNNFAKKGKSGNPNRNFTKR